MIDVVNTDFSARDHHLKACILVFCIIACVYYVGGVFAASRMVIKNSDGLVAEARIVITAFVLYPLFATMVRCITRWEFADSGTVARWVCPDMNELQFKFYSQWIVASPWIGIPTLLYSLALIAVSALQSVIVIMFVLHVCTLQLVFGLIFKITHT